MLGLKEGKEKKEQKEPRGRGRGRGGKAAESGLPRRSRIVHEITLQQQKEDSFASILAAETECVALARFNGKFYIAANGVYQKKNVGVPTKTSQKIISSIEEIFNFFKKIAKGESVSHKERLKTFLKVCSKKRLDLRVKEQADYINVTNVDWEKIAEKIFEKNGSFDAYDHRKQYNNNMEGASFVGGFFQRIYHSFIGLEKSLKGEGIVKLDQEQLNAFKEKPVILCKEKAKNVHAEVQLLAYLFEEIEKISCKEENKKEEITEGEKEEEEIEIAEEEEVFIGISKLCCLGCDCMLSKANDISQSIKFSKHGTHGIYFSGWEVPAIFAEGYESGVVAQKDGREPEIPSTKSRNAAYKIGYLSGFYINKVAKESKNSKGGMYAQSPMSSQEKNTTVIDFPSHLDNFLVLLSSGKDISAVKNEVSIALAIQAAAALTTLYQQLEEAVEVNKLLVFSSLFVEVEDKRGLKLDRNILLDVLQNPLLVGEKLSRLFKDFKIEETMTRSEEELENRSEIEKQEYEESSERRIAEQSLEGEETGKKRKKSQFTTAFNSKQKTGKREEPKEEMEEPRKEKGEEELPSKIKGKKNEEGSEKIKKRKTVGKS